MHAITGLGQWLYAIPMLAFGAVHFMTTESMAGFVPFPPETVWVYVTGVALIAAAVSMFIGKYDKLATVLLAVMLILFVILLWIPGASGGDQNATTMLLKDTALAGGALMYARGLAQDNSVIG
jgi:uncharacterized membrane protein